MYENMTAAELREVTQPLKGSGLWWPCAFDAVEQRWRKSSCGTPLLVPEAAAMLERACEELLKDKGYELTHVNQFHSNSGVKYVREFVGGVDGKPNGIHGIGVTPLHALVKAVEAVQGASEPKPANEPASVAVVHEAKATIKATKTAKYKPYHYSIEMTVGDMRVCVVHRTHGKTANLHLQRLFTDSHCVMTMDRAALLELRKAIDAAIERIGGGQ